MAAELHARDVKVLLFAAAAGAAAAGTLAFYFAPLVFRPWPAALAVFLLAGLAGAVSCWTLVAEEYAFPLALLLLPIFRLGLLLLRHGGPPWPVSGWGWVIGDGFAWWAAASLATAGYAGAFVHRHARISSCLTDLRRGLAPAYEREVNLTEVDCRAISRLYLTPALCGAALFTFLGAAGESLLVLACGASFLVCGLCVVGLTYARHKAYVWLSQDFETEPGTEGRWLAGYGRYLWPLLLLLPLLPGGFRPLDPWHLLENLFLTPVTPPPGLDRLPVGPRGLLPKLVHVGPGLLGQAVMVIVLILYGIICVLAAAASIAACLLVLRGLGRTVLGWLRGLGPLWRGIARFLAGLDHLLRGALSFSARTLRRPWRRKGSRVEVHDRPPGRRWSTSRTRMLFARLVLWGREHGLALPSSLSPAEIGRDLATVLPGQEEDLAFFVEVYRRERYGERKPGRQERRLYRRAWERAVRSGKPPPARAGGKPEEERG